jgi:hypothetical protein
MPDVPDPVAREPSCGSRASGHDGRVCDAVRAGNGRRENEEVVEMATREQTAAAERNIKKARTVAKRQRTIAHLPDRTRQQLYDEAKKRNIPGRSKMGKWGLVEALRKSR